MSHFEEDTEDWWGVLAANLGEDADGNQLYPDYSNFKNWVKDRFWKDTDTQIKQAAWERLRQNNFKDRTLFFQKFEQLTMEARVAGDKLVIVMQIKKVV